VLSALVTLPQLLDPERWDVDSDKPALSDGTDRIGYVEWSERAGRIASALVSLGVGHGDRVGVHLRKSAHSFVAVHGVLRAGAVMVPIDPMAPVDTVADVLTDAGARVVISDARREQLEAIMASADLRGAIVRTSRDVESIDAVPIVWWSELDAHDVAPVPDLDPDADAYIIYTSGSTGHPKGIVHTHRSALAYVRLAAEAYGLGAADRFANIAGLHFDQSTFELYVAPFVGAAVTVVPDPVLKFPASLSELVENEGVTVWYSVPYVLRQLVTRGALDVRDLSAIRWILYGGESYPPDELAALMQQFPGATVSNVYGPAEVNQCTHHELTDPPGAAPVPIGCAWNETEAIVVDAAGERVAGGSGELWIASTTMMDRYWNRPDLTDAAIVDRRFAGCSATRWYRTGDLVVEDDHGRFVFLGRADNQVKIRGQRIELESIDRTLRELDAIDEVAAVVIEDSEGESGLVAVVQLVSGAEIALREVQQHVARSHARVAVPVDLVTVDTLERTATGKVDRNAAHDLAASRSRR
jgi:amino acid adenylation domain-containing protein